MEGEGKEFLGFGWRSLRSILENRFMSTIYIWIFILPVLINIGADLPLSVLVRPFQSEPDIRIDLKLPFSLYSLYYSALCFSIARLAYTYFSVLPAYFSAQGMELRTSLDQLRANYGKIDVAWHNGEFNDPSGILLYDVLSQVKFRESESRPGYYELRSKRNEQLIETTVLVEREQFLKTIAWDLIRLQDIAYPKARKSVFLFLALGILFFIIPLLQNFWLVSSFFFTSFLG